LIEIDVTTLGADEAAAAIAARIAEPSTVR
jgi:hypothetical protein